MFENIYSFSKDLQLVRDMVGMLQEDLAKELNVGIATVNRWENGETHAADINIEKFYDFVYKRGIELNAIKAQFYQEELGRGEKLLFHGSKKGIEGKLSLGLSKNSNDFGAGFYCGESFRQAALFVSNFPEACSYILSFKTAGLKKAEFQVDRDWLLAIGIYRGSMNSAGKYSERLMKKVDTADYIVAPIADNRMFQIIDSFVDGVITDEQCIHALAATNLGMQYIMKSESALKSVTMLERCYICNSEKEYYKTRRLADLAVSEDKVNAARIKYRGKGKYIDELI